MPSLDRNPLTSAPELDPSQINRMTTPANRSVVAYYSPYDQRWLVHHDPADMSDKRVFWSMTGIDATDWPEVWAEIIEKEQEG